MLLMNYFPLNQKPTILIDMRLGLSIDLECDASEFIAFRHYRLYRHNCLVFG